MLIDLSKPKHRWILFVAGGVLTVLLVAVLIGGYQVYEYTESAEFCGTVCHPMEPVYAQHERSPHANVKCADCHIGPGTSFFVRSKIDGLRQVYAVLTDSYSRPIKSPVHNLRPARETCQECHTPTLFKDNIIKSIIHYDDDEANTRIKSTLILKMGGTDNEGKGISQGIHWHVSNPVYFIASDEQRQAIVWVGVEQEDGSLKEYWARDMLVMDGMDFVENAREDGRLREMDCIDCHNRTAHFIPEPENLVADAMIAGRISDDLPNIYARSVEILENSYASEEEAFAVIDSLAETYRAGEQSALSSANDGELPVRQQDEVDAALEELKELYTSTNFPNMRLNWKTNPNNARHTASPGCFRCHDGKHINVDPSGKVTEAISVECNTCHTVPIIGRGDDVLLDAPVITGPVPESHASFSWTIEHRTTTVDQSEDCLNCHGKAFCNNGVCHNLEHPPDMLFTHADEYYKRGDQVCYTCHQDVLCSRCHPAGIVENP